MKIFTDGGCIRNGKYSARGSYGIKFEDVNFKFANVSGEIRRFNYEIKNDILTFGKIEIPPTNIRAEMIAIIIALHLVKIHRGKEAIEIVTDSKFCIDVATLWITNWQLNNFNGKANPDLLVIFFDLLQFHDVHFIHVKGHAKGETENEIGNIFVDKLAKKIIESDTGDYKMIAIKN
jgi:ribonuclease HI